MFKCVIYLPTDHRALFSSGLAVVFHLADFIFWIFTVPGTLLGRVSRYQVG